MNTTIQIRKATCADAPFLAQCVVAALGDDFASNLNDPAKMQTITSVCQRSDTLYSWTNAWIALYNNEVAGAIVGYDGKRYASLRHTTFQLLADLLDEETKQMAAETQEGEYYLDSIAVKPQFRNRGIARQLLLHAINYFTTQKRQPVTLVVLPDNQARRLYESVGFKPDTNIFLFGEDYLRCKYLPV